MVLEGDSGRLERAGENAATRNVRAAALEGQGIARAGEALASGVAQGIGNYYQAQQFNEQLKNGQAERAMAEQRFMQTGQKMAMMAQSKQLEMLAHTADMAESDARLKRHMVETQIAEDENKRAEQDQFMGSYGTFLKDGTPHRVALDKAGGDDYREVPVPMRGGGATAGDTSMVRDFLAGAAGGEGAAAGPAPQQLAQPPIPVQAQQPRDRSAIPSRDDVEMLESMARPLVKKQMKSDPEFMATLKRQGLNANQATEKIAAAAAKIGAQYWAMGSMVTYDELIEVAIAAYKRNNDANLYEVGPKVNQADNPQSWDQDYKPPPR